MTRRNIVKIVAVLIGASAVLLACLACYLRFADLGGWRDTVAERVSDRIGREVTIAGEFHPEIGFTTRLSAGDITLANPGWSRDPTMASIQHLTVELRLLSLVFAPVRIHDIEIEGARVLLEKNVDGQANWDFETGADAASAGNLLDLELQHVLVKDLRLTWRKPSRPAPLEAGIAYLEATEDLAGMLDLDFDGTVDHREVKITGRLGTLTGLLNAGAVECDLAGQVGEVQFKTTGDIADLETLGGVNLTADIHGADLLELRGILELPSELSGPFNLAAGVSPASTGSDLTIDASVAGISAKASGNLDSLVNPRILDLTVTASGPSIRTIGALRGVTDLPDEGFSVSGGVRWEGFPITFRQVEISVGENSLSADGVLGEPPAMMGTDFSLRGQGPNLSAIGGLAGIRLPSEEFTVEGRVVRAEGGLRVEGMSARIGSTGITVDGMVGDPPDHAGTILSVHAEGPNIAHFNDLTGIELPAESFKIDGRLAGERSMLNLEGVAVRIGDSSLRADGTVTMVEGLVGTTLRVDAQGSDASDLRALTGLEDLPAEAWTASGGVSFLDSGLLLDGVSAKVGSLQARGDGVVALTRGAVGTGLRLHAEDPDLAHAMSIFGVNGFPQVMAWVDGELKVEADGYGVNGVTGSVGDIDLAVDGLVGAASNLDGTAGRVSVHGPRLSSLGQYLRQTGWPEAPFSVVGNHHNEKGAYTLDNVVVHVEHNRATIDGTLFLVKGLIGTDVEITLSAPDLRQAGRLAAGLTTVRDLPAEPLTLATRLRIDGKGYEINGLRATLDRTVASADGRVGAAADLVGTDLKITADGPVASLLTAVTGLDLPAAPMSIRGRVQRTDTAFLFDHASVQIGDHRIRLHGSLGERPRLVGTDLELYMAGSDTSLIAALTGVSGLPDRPFTISGHFNGTAERFTARNFEVAYGESDTRGSLDIDIRGKPFVTARLRSDLIRFDDLGPPRPEPNGGQSEAANAPARPKNRLLISDTPIGFGWLGRFDADVSITATALQTALQRFHDVELTAQLEDGRLEVQRLSMVGSHGGSGSGSAVLEPVDSGYRAHLLLDINDIQFDDGAEDGADTPPGPLVDIDVQLQAEGTNPHGFASSTDGSIQVVVGKGAMDNRLLDAISQDILITLLTAFNPFSKDAATTELECAIALLTFDDGIAKLDPMAMQSDKMTMLGKGTIDLRTEDLDLEWITKPRKGFGLSASVITNPYIKLGGTIGDPVIQLKPMEAIATTGVAVATMGISLVVKGMFDRITAEKKVCQRALEEITHRVDDSTEISRKRK